MNHEIVDPRTYDPDLGLGYTAGWHHTRHTPEMIIIHTNRDVADYRRATVEYLTEMRKSLWMRCADVDRLLGVREGSVISWERNINKCFTLNRLAWIRSLWRARDEIREWENLSPQVTRAKSGLTVKNLTRVLNEHISDVQRWDLGGWDLDGESLSNIRHRWAKVCYVAYIRRTRTFRKR